MCDALNVIIVTNNTISVHYRLINLATLFKREAAPRIVSVLFAIYRHLLNAAVERAPTNV